VHRITAHRTPGGTNPATARHYSSSFSLPTIVSTPAPITPTRNEAQVPSGTRVKKKHKLDHPPPPDKEWLTQEEAAYIMYVSVSFLNKDRCEAKKTGRPPIVPFKRVGKKSIRIKQPDVHTYMASDTVGAPKP
jgi:hypothetical protein